MVNGPLLSIHTTFAKLNIDQTACWENLGIKSNEVVTKEWAAEAKRHVQEFDRETVSDGYRVMHLDHHEKDVFAHIAKEKMMKQCASPDSFHYSPNVEPKITFVPGSLDIKYIGQRFDVKG